MFLRQSLQAKTYKMDDTLCKFHTLKEAKASEAMSKVDSST